MTSGRSFLQIGLGTLCAIAGGLHLFGAFHREPVSGLQLAIGAVLLALGGVTFWQWFRSRD